MKVEERSDDQAFQLLADRRRRRIIGYLHETVDNSATFDEIVDCVVEDETNSSRPDEHSVTIDLHHVHLPMLDDAGVIDYDSRSELIRYWGTPKIKELLDAAASLEGRTDTDGLTC